MNELDSRYSLVKHALCPDCPFVTTCAQFPEQMDACYDALLVMNEEGDDLPDSFTAFIAQAEFRAREEE